MLQYATIDLHLPRLVQGKYASYFVSTGHYVNSGNFDLAIHFQRFSEWTLNFKFEDSKECDPERIYKNAWSLAFLGIVINWIEV